MGYQEPSVTFSISDGNAVRVRYSMFQDLIYERNTTRLAILSATLEKDLHKEHTALERKVLEAMKELIEENLRVPKDEPS